MKNILAENLLRFGVKNLSESSQKQLVVKSIMETINQHGLHTEVRRALTEADAPKDPNAAIEIWSPGLGNVGDVYKTGDVNGTSQPLVIQSPTSIGEASKILGGIMKLVGQGKAESPEMISLAKQVSANNYPAILWKVRYGSTFKSSTGSNYNTVCDWLSKFVDKSYGKAGGSSAGGKYSGGNPLGAISDFFRGTETADAIENQLRKFNTQEQFRND